jgi:hypothetical protein
VPWTISGTPDTGIPIFPKKEKKKKKKKEKKSE